MKNIYTGPKRLYYGFYLFVCIVTAVSLKAHTPDPHIPSAGFKMTESAFCRKELVDTWFKAEAESVKTKEPRLIQNETGDYFLVRQEEENGELQIIVAPLVRQKVLLKTNNGDASAIAGTEDEDTSSSEIWVETWPKDAPGSWILYRDSLSGKALRIRCYFVQDTKVYVEFSPGPERSYADFIIFGASAAGRVPVPLPFEQLYVMSFDELLHITRYTLPWNYTRVFLHSYNDIMQMTGMIRSLLPSLQKTGFAADKNASIDFLKWIVDGLVKPLTGAVIAPEKLKINTVEGPKDENPKLRGSASAHSEENFGSLNAIRNMAAAAISARTGIVYHYNNSGADVKTEAFSYYTDTSGTARSAGFSANSGYPVEMLKPLLYVLGVTEAHRFFLGAVRQSAQSDGAEETVRRPVFTEAAAFFPWFDRRGRLQVSVFEKGREYTLDEFIEKYRGSFVFLVRVKASMEFYPDRMEPSGE
ncbi:hypothetical protein V1L52_12915 [Treponema sp. HNW]|uniref:hypothetical protein n=1 Tax=Treponema sp. HNW TaxID=3116654 RepID=UPI003D0FB5A4